MECWKWDTVSSRFVEIISASLQPEIRIKNQNLSDSEIMSTIKELVLDEEILDVRRLLYKKLEIEIPEHLREPPSDESF